mmetsp:Transcript_30022/g.28700  ORF Transcript_30022/g.28700 Transcript_30022/m.28700 type:complete len:90 (+) Transcript_30022:193-462(+)
MFSSIKTSINKVQLQGNRVLTGAPFCDFITAYKGSKCPSRARTEGGQIRPHSARPLSKDLAIRTAPSMSVVNSITGIITSSLVPIHVSL